MALLACLLSMALCLMTTPAQAHRTSAAQLDLRLDRDPAELTIDLSAHDLAIALGETPALDRPVPAELLARTDGALRGWLGQRVALRVAGQACALAGVQRHAGDGEAQQLQTQWRCPPLPAGTDWSLDYRLMADIDPAHIATGRALAPGALAVDLLFDAQVQRQGGQALAQPGFSSLLMLGVKHILGGLDHVCFVLALVVAISAPGPLVRAVTAFTAGHALTLALAWFGWLRLPAAPVELAIALSVAVVAASGLAGRRPDGAWVMAGVFGLVHGLGFFGALSPELTAAGAVRTLVGFNLGVEIGQLVIVLPAAALMASLGPWRQQAARFAQWPILLLALAWSIERAAELRA